MFFRKKPVIVMVNGKKIEAGGGGGKSKRSWADWIGMKLIQLSAIAFVAMYIKSLWIVS